MSIFSFMKERKARNLMIELAGARELVASCDEVPAWKASSYYCEARARCAKLEAELKLLMGGNIKWEREEE